MRSPRSAPAARSWGQPNGSPAGPLFDRSVVEQPGHVTAHHEPGYLVRLAVLVDAGVQDIKDRHSGPQPQVADLVGPGHPGADLLSDPAHGVLLVFQHAVDAVGVRYLVLEQAGAFGDRPGDVGGDPVYR